MALTGRYDAWKASPAGKANSLTVIQTTVKLFRICLRNYLSDDDIVLQRCFSIERGGRNERKSSGEGDRPSDENETA